MLEHEIKKLHASKEGKKSINLNLPMEPHSTIEAGRISAQEFWSPRHIRSKSRKNR